MKDRHAALAETLSHFLERHGLARSGRTGDDAMAIGHVHQEVVFSRTAFC
jgi:hypothetical protein